MTVRDSSSEFEILARLAARSDPGSAELFLGIGDDAAVLKLGDSCLAVSADALVEGVHFEMSYFSIADLAAKSIAVNASDIAAMGAVPKYFLVTITTPGTLDTEELLVALARACTDYDASLIGGDLSAGRELSISVTAIGVFSPDCQVLTRSGAQVGDAIMVTGPLGASALGLRRLKAASARLQDDASRAHLRPQAQVIAGTTAARSGAHAAIDVSDGLLADLEHLLVASKVGATLFEVPVFASAELDDALYGGEDYQLILATPEPQVIAAAFAKAQLELPIHIGTCLEEPDARLLFGQSYSPRGYQHHL